MLVILLLVVALIGYVWQQYTRTQRLIRIGVALANKTLAYQRQDAQAKFRILITGDSTGVGVGASQPENSIAGLVGKQYPEAEIVNLAVSGAKVADVPKQLVSINDDSFDLVMLHIGGNDVVRFTNYANLDLDLRQVLQLAKRKGKYVLLTSTGNVGTVPLLPAATRWIFARRTRRVRKICKAAVAALHTPSVRFTDLFRERAKDPYAQDPVKYYAADKFHPSDAGYADWFALISPELEAFAKL